MVSVVYTCRQFFKGVPLQRMTGSQNLFVWFRGVLICQRGLIPRRTKSFGVSETAGKILQSIRPPGTRSCGISDLAEPWQTWLYSRHLFCRVWYPADQCPAGPDTPPNKVMRGIRPCGTKSCGVSKHREQLLNMNMTFKREKTRDQRSLATVPFTKISILTVRVVCRTTVVHREPIS